MSESLSAGTVAVFDRPSNRKTIAALAARAGNLVLFPELRPEKTPDGNFAAMVGELGADDWLVFEDVWAVDCFLEALAARSFDLFALDELRIGALGEAVSDRLRFSQLHADVIPARLDAASVFAAIDEYQGGGWPDRRVLIAAGAGRSEALAGVFARAGARVERLSVYRLTTPADANLSARAKALLAGGAVDEFVFTQVEELIMLEHFFPDDALAALLAETVVLATGEPVFQNLAEHGLRPLYFHSK